MEKYLFDNNIYSVRDYRQNYKDNIAQLIPTTANNSLVNQFIKTLNIFYSNKNNKKQNNYLNTNCEININDNSTTRVLSKHPKSSKNRKVNISM